MYKKQKFNVFLKGGEIMSENRENRSKGTEESETSRPKSSCCDFAGMSQMVRRFCRSKGGKFDCGEMMKVMCGMAPKESKES